MLRRLGPMLAAAACASPGAGTAACAAALLMQWFLANVAINAPHFGPTLSTTTLTLLNDVVRCVVSPAER